MQVKGPGGSGYLTDVVSMSNGVAHSLALKADGTVWAWGSNANGQLGDNTTVQKITPVQVKGQGGSGYLTDVVAIAAGGNHNLSLKSDGTIWAWGDNSFGQLGDNSTTQRNTPVPVSSLTNVVAVRIGASAMAWQSGSMALKADGTVWGWGYNQFGRIGDNSTTQRNVPTQVMGQGGTGNLTGVMAISTGYAHSIGVKTDGTAWAWGWNSNGGLGDNSTTQRNTPVQVLNMP